MKLMNQEGKKLKRAKPPGQIFGGTCSSWSFLFMLLSIVYLVTDFFFCQFGYSLRQFTLIGQMELL